MKKNHLIKILFSDSQSQELLPSKVIKLLSSRDYQFYYKEIDIRDWGQSIKNHVDPHLLALSEYTVFSKMINQTTFSGRLGGGGGVNMDHTPR